MWPPTEVEPDPPPPPPELGAGAGAGWVYTGAGPLGGVVEVSVTAEGPLDWLVEEPAPAETEGAAAGWLRRRRRWRRWAERLRPVTPGTNWEASSALAVVVGGVDATVGRALLIAAVVAGGGVGPAVAW